MSNEAQSILGAGKVELNLYSPLTRAFLGFGDPLEADSFELTPDSEIKEKTSKSREAYGQAIASVALAKPTKIKIVISAANREALSLQFQGLIEDYNQGAGPVTETFNAQLDKWHTLPKRNLDDDGFVVTKGDASGTFTLGKDYAVNYATGQIKFLSTGTVVQGASMKVVGNAIAVSGKRIRGGTQTRVRCQARWVGVNMVDDTPIIVTVHEAQLRSTQGFDFLAGDFNGIQLEGTLVKPADKTEAFTVDIDDAVTV